MKQKVSISNKTIPGFINASFIKCTMQTGYITYCPCKHLYITYCPCKHLYFPDETTWTTGSSMIHWAGIRAGKRATVFPELVRPSTKWHGQRGMRWDQLMPKIERPLQKEPTPSKMVIHLGGNDVDAGDSHYMVRPDY